MRIAIGYPPLADEARMLSENAAETPLDALECVASAQEVLSAIESSKSVFVEESLNRYVVAVLRHSRSDSRLYLGASPRAGLALLRVAKARALVAGRDFVEPDDIKVVAPTVLAHRLILSPEARSGGIDAAELVRDIIERTPVPSRHARRTGAAGSSPSEVGSTSPRGRSARRRSTRWRSGSCSPCSPRRSGSGCSSAR